jgi:hypothetical protein
VATSAQELLSELMLSHKESPRLVAVILCSFGYFFGEPSNSLFNMVFSSQG